MDISTLMKKGRNVVLVKEKGISGEVVNCVVEGVYTVRGNVMNADQNITYAQFAMVQVKKQI